MAASVAGAVVPGGGAVPSPGTEQLWRSKREDAATEAEVDPARARYAERHSDENELWLKYTKATKDLETELARLVSAASLPGHTPSPADLSAIRRTEFALRTARENVGRLTRLYQAWHAGQVTTHSERHEFVFRLDDLRGKVLVGRDGTMRITPGSADPGREFRSPQEAWDLLGLAVQLVELDGPGREPVSEAQARRQAVPTRGVWMRRPRRVQLWTWRRRDPGSNLAELVSVEERLVVDARAETSLIRFKSSLWSRRKVALTVSPVGGLASYDYAGGSAGAAAGQTLQDAPATVSGGLEQAGLLRGHVVRLRDAEATELAERTKRQLDLKENALKLAGLTATEHDFAEVERLKQRKELLETLKAINTEEAAEALAREMAATR